MTGDAGFEPVVGEIRAIRTFRIGAGGCLYPLFNSRGWGDGVNEAVCAQGGAHAAPDPDCTCGIYAYSSEAAAREYPHARYVLAAVSLWGNAVLGTRGLRAQYARIDAIWFSDVVPESLAGFVTERYPNVHRCSTREQLLAEHPPTPPTGPDVPRLDDLPGVRLAGRVVAGCALILGVVPAGWLGRLPYAWTVWSVVLAALVIRSIFPRRRRGDRTAHRRRLVSSALALWMISPLTGVAGLIFLRLPLIQIGVLTLVHRIAMDRLARTFPAPI